MSPIQFINYARKFLVAVGAALGVLAVALVDNSVSPQEWIQVAIAALGAVGVYSIPNKEV